MDKKTAAGGIFSLILILGLAILFYYLFSNILNSVNDYQNQKSEKIEKNNQAIVLLSSPSLSNKEIVDFYQKNKAYMQPSFTQLVATVQSSNQTITAKLMEEQINTVKNQIVKENKNLEDKNESVWKSIPPLSTIFASIIAIFFTRLIGNFADFCSGCLRKFFKNMLSKLCPYNHYLKE